MDENVLKGVIDALVVERGHLMPAEWIATTDDIVIPDEEDEIVAEGGAIPRHEEEPGSTGKPAGGGEGELLRKISEGVRSEFVNDQI